MINQNVEFQTLGNAAQAPSAGLKFVSFEKGSLAASQLAEGFETRVHCHNSVLLIVYSYRNMAGFEPNLLVEFVCMIM
jgi:hypothetical protein